MYNQPARPPVWKWYVVYCLFMGFIYFLCIAAGVFWLVTNPGPVEADPLVFKFMGLVFIGFGTMFLAAYMVALVLPREPWVWIYHLVLICFGLTSGCTLPASIPLLIFWLKPDVKQWYGREP